MRCIHNLTHEFNKCASSHRLNEVIQVGSLPSKRGILLPEMRVQRPEFLDLRGTAVCRIDCLTNRRAIRLAAHVEAVSLSCPQFFSLNLMVNALIFGAVFCGTQ